MSASEPAPKVLTVEKALSGRSTCRATGELIAKGDIRVGLEAFVGGRVSMTWQVGALSSASCSAGLLLRQHVLAPREPPQSPLADASDAQGLLCALTETAAFPTSLPPGAQQEQCRQMQAVGEAL